MQLRHRKNTIAEEQESRIWKSHGLKHLCDACFPPSKCNFHMGQIQLYHLTNPITMNLECSEKSCFFSLKAFMRVSVVFWNSNPLLFSSP